MAGGPAGLQQVSGGSSMRSDFKSLDHQAVNFKQNDTKALRSPRACSTRRERFHDEVRPQRRARPQPSGALRLRGG